MNESSPRALAQFFATSIDERLARAEESAVERAIVDHVKRAAARVPAYRAFLRAAGVDPSSIATLDDVRRLPATSKDNYYRQYPLCDLAWDGSLAGWHTVALSSGSTGEPAAWPRALEHELGVATRFEQVLHDGFRAHQRSTLAVVCFALGSWVGGMYTAACMRHLAAKGYPLTVSTPGNQPAEIVRALKLLGPSYEQIVLLGYPPFLKDLVDTAPALGFPWPAGQVRLVTAGEVFSEDWRSLVCRRLGSTEPERDVASVYGTADGGVLACETPLSVSIRRFLGQRADAARELFGDTRMPTLCQYDPLHRFFEADQGELLFSADGPIPLMRYRILDRGGVRSFADMLAFCAARGFAVPPSSAPVREMPFVWVFGRDHFAVSMDGANIYPEQVAPALEQGAVAEVVTGKFVLSIVHDEGLDPYLQCDVELLPGAPASDALSLRIAGDIRRLLEQVSSEFANYVPAARRTPRVLLRPHRDPEWFPAGVKHRYTRTR